MSIQFTILGIAELKDALGKLPTELKGQATQIVLDTAYAAAADVRNQYPTGPGTSKNGRKVPPGQLKQGVKVFPIEVGPFAVAAQVRSTSPHAWWHENGPLLKFRETRKKWPRGTMFGVKGIPRPVFIPTMIRHRHRMYQQLAVLLESVGLIATHDAAA